jgi:hypothetical protein
MHDSGVHARVPTYGVCACYVPVCVQVVTLQGQLSDALQDVGLAKRREEGHKGAYVRGGLWVGQ